MLGSQAKTYFAKTYTDLKHTILIQACSKGHTAIVQTLIDAGADVNACTSDGVTPLLIACKNGNIEIVKALIVGGSDGNKADVNKARTSDGSTLLHIACKRGFTEVAQALFEAGANVDCLKQGGLLFGYRNTINEKLINNKPEETINLIKKFIDPEEIKKRDERLKNINKPHSDTTSPSGETLGGMQVGGFQARR